MKIGIFSDIHLGLVQYGLKEREEDFYQQYLKAINTFVEKKVDAVIIGGDVFDKPRPSPKTLQVFSKGISILIKNNIKIFNIVGNHSMIQSSDFVTTDEFFNTFENLDSYMLLDENNKFDNEQVNIMGIPYHYNSSLDEFIEKVNIMNNSLEGSKKFNILVIHQAFKEFCGFTMEELSINDINTDNFDLIVCGHIHERKMKNLNERTVFLQPGSLERSNVAEARDEENNGKGVFILDTDNKFIQFIPLKCNRRFLIAHMYMNKKDDLKRIKDEILEQVQNDNDVPVLFLTVNDSTKSFTSLMDLIKSLNKKCLTVDFKYYDESHKVDGNLLENNKDILSPTECLKIALNPFDLDEHQLGLDLYNLLQDGKDAKELLDKFIIKKRKEYVDVNNQEYNYDELSQFEEFFKKI